MAKLAGVRWSTAARAALVVLLLLAVGSVAFARPGPADDGDAWRTGSWREGLFAGDWLYGVHARRRGPPSGPRGGHGDDHGEDPGGPGGGPGGGWSGGGPHAGPGGPPEGEEDGGRVPPSRRCVAQPDQRNLRVAFKQTFQRWLARQRRHYKEQYYRLHYSLDITDMSISGDHATVLVSYEGSVLERATGISVNASGDASATFAWIHCGWNNTDLTYPGSDD